MLGISYFLNILLSLYKIFIYSNYITNRFLNILYTIKNINVVHYRYNILSQVIVYQVIQFLYT